jgi:hypothetical protein
MGRHCLVLLVLVRGLYGLDGRSEWVGNEN